VDLALARIRDNIGQLRGPVQRSAQDTLKRRLGGRVKVAHLRYYLGAALLAALVGIAVNALLLQRERHPAPLFGYAAPKSLSAAPNPAPAPAPAPAAPQKPASAADAAPPTESSAAPPPARPAEAGKSSAATDPIGELLAGEGHGDAQHLVLTAQTALAKLGYSVKPDGKEGAATEQALRDFEHAHGLTPSTELTERLVKQLTAAARAGGH
jgi:Putative peptidoglycan binding domain